jgi:hypothetical protein
MQAWQLPAIAPTSVHHNEVCKIQHQGQLDSLEIGHTFPGDLKAVELSSNAGLVPTFKRPCAVRQASLCMEPRCSSFKS